MYVPRSSFLGMARQPLPRCRPEDASTQTVAATRSKQACSPPQPVLSRRLMLHMVGDGCSTTGAQCVPHPTAAAKAHTGQQLLLRADAAERRRGRRVQSGVRREQPQLGHGDLALPGREADALQQTRRGLLLRAGRLCAAGPRAARPRAARGCWRRARTPAQARVVAGGPCYPQGLLHGSPEAQQALQVKQHALCWCAG